MSTDQQLGNPALLALATSHAGKNGDREESPNHFTKWGLLVAGGLIGSFILYKVGERVYRNIRFNKAVKDVFTYGNPEDAARKLINAIKGMGTDEATIRSVVRAIPNQRELRRVAAAYKALTKGDSLMEDLEDDLGPTEQNELVQIIRVKPETGTAVNQEALLDSWAIRIREALAYESYQWQPPWLTSVLPNQYDFDAIKAVILEIPRMADLARIEQAYRKKYFSSALADVLEEISNDEWNELKKIIIEDKPDGNSNDLQQLLLHGS